MSLINIKIGKCYLIPGFQEYLRCENSNDLLRLIRILLTIEISFAVIHNPDKKSIPVVAIPDIYRETILELCIKDEEAG